MAVATVALLVVAIVDIGPPTHGARTATEIVTAADGVVQSTVSGSGNVEPAVQEVVNFRTSGTLQAIYVHVGEHVHKGQLLAELNPSSAQLALDQAQLDLTAAQDNLNSAQSADPAGTGSSSAAATAVSPAARRGGVPGTASGGSTTASGASSRGSGAAAPGGLASPSPATIASDQAAVDGATEQVDNAEQTLADAKLYAPISGTVVSLENISPGDSVSTAASGRSTSAASPGSPSASATGGALAAAGLGSSSSSSSSSSGFAEIVNTSALTMTVPLSESDISAVKVSQPATVTLDALTGVQLAAHVSAISPVGSNSSGVVSYDVTLTLDQSSPEVRPGMSAEASIITAQASGVTLPNAAVPGTGSLATVHVRSGGRTVARQVVVGLRGTGRTQIVSGLSAGQQVVVTETLPPLGSVSISSSATSSGTLGPAGGFGGGALGGAGLGGFGARRLFRRALDG
jgi:multidrug efflux pump subunit AcrA (membrane-fusion protein)